MLQMFIAVKFLFIESVEVCHCFGFLTHYKD